MHFDQLLLAACKAHVVYSDQLLGAALHLHFIYNHNICMNIFTIMFLVEKTFLLWHSMDERVKLDLRSKNGFKDCF